MEQARCSLEWPEWEKAIQSELAQLREKGTWKLVEKPKNAILISNKWVLTKKRDKEGNVIKYKARLVAHGFTQCLGLDYDETFSPIVHFETIRALLAMVAGKKLKVRQLDVKRAYLNGILTQPIYMEQPIGFEDGSGLICLLIKSIYSLKQAGWVWNIEFNQAIQRLGFRALILDVCTYILHDGDDFITITVWVNDLLLFATTEELIEWMKAGLEAEWELTDLGEPVKIVGIEITLSDCSITISQHRYLESILQKEHMDKANAVGMPLDPNVVLEPNLDGSAGDQSNSYARLIGELQFVANATRPDIAHAISRLSSYTVNPTMQHVSALKRVLRYLSGTRLYGITYGDILGHPNPFLRYADAAFTNLDEQKSTTGYIFMMAGGAITWHSKKQSITALLSTEAEYIALSEAVHEAQWLRNLFKELGFRQTLPTMILGDNEGSIAMTKNPQFHKRAKHIDLQYHSIRELVQEGEIIIKSCRSHSQTADVLTKPLPQAKHKQHTAEMGLALA